MASWEGVNEFVAVAEVGSFTQAAERLHTSVANISRRVLQLEERLGIKLLLRTTRKVSLTEAGMLYYQQCKVLVDGLLQAEQAITQIQHTPSGKIKVTAPVTYGEQKIAPLLHDFLLLYPQLELELVLTNQKLDLIDQGIDLAIRLGQLEDSSFIARKLSDRRLYVCASEDYLAQYGTPYALSELTHHSCLIGTHDHWRFKEYQQSRSIKVSGRIRCSSGMVLLDAALKGMGLAQLPDYYVTEPLAQGRLVEVLATFRDDREGVWALYPQNRHLSTKVRLLVDHLTQHLSL
ncbi:LysR family transcriptional regulator [Vibrio metschnikovii]|uniref:LysR family transcriptional regulator n=1 Tax=Vibrio metschnikovii TaxID=28172 RepID=A0A9X0R766_VIBME|nr:LysR family transcriptional regulator [Vibrio metschnikovii]MBC5849716.1 LysR family transcriptional regulator [Vibrio metschnikovii]MDA3137621.1 LysR family transcriptional regulator [Vibrio metschnikovii]